MDESLSNENVCVTCKSVLYGEYCHNCGEKVISDKDFTLKNLFEQAFDAIAHIDSKLLKSFACLIFKPGQLSLASVRGNRKTFMKPFQIFIITNMLFFIFLTNVDVFRIPSGWWISHPDYLGFSVSTRVNEIKTSKKITMAEFATLYDFKSNTLAKGFVIVLLPVISLIMAVLNIKKKLQIGKHLIFATHFFSFALFFILLWTELVRLIPSAVFSNLFWSLPILLILLTHLTISIKNFYNDKWLWSIAKGIIALVLIFVAIDLYRSGISILALNLIA